MIERTYDYRFVLMMMLQRFSRTFILLIVAFGLFSIGSMVYFEATLAIGIILFIMYFIGAIICMLILITIYSYIQYRSHYKGIVFGYEVDDENISLYQNKVLTYKSSLDKVELIQYRKYSIIDTVDGEIGVMKEEDRRKLIEEA